MSALPTMNATHSINILAKTSFKEPYHVQQAIVNTICIMVCFSIHYMI